MVSGYEHVMTMKPKWLTISVICFLAVAALAEPRVRPAEWARPVVGTRLQNCYQVTPHLFRSKQPRARDTAELKALGIRTVVTLRDRHGDAPLERSGSFRLVQVPMDAGSVTREELLQALRVIRDAPKPVLVHCWHGSDRTGVVVAAYRMVFQGWSQERAIDELVNGGYGFHAQTYGNLVSLLQSIEPSEWRQELGLP